MAVAPRIVAKVRKNALQGGNSRLRPGLEKLVLSAMEVERWDDRGVGVLPGQQGQGGGAAGEAWGYGVDHCIILTRQPKRSALPWGQLGKGGAAERGLHVAILPQVLLLREGD
jgi:hypothetical protein